MKKDICGPGLLINSISLRPPFRDDDRPPKCTKCFSYANGKCSLDGKAFDEYIARLHRGDWHTRFLGVPEAEPQVDGGFFGCKGKC